MDRNERNHCDHLFILNKHVPARDPVSMTTTTASLASDRVQPLKEQGPLQQRKDGPYTMKGIQ